MATKLPTTSLHVATAPARKKICSSSLSVRWNTIQSVTDALTCPTCQQDDVPRFLLFAPVINTFRGGEATFTSTRGPCPGLTASLLLQKCHFDWTTRGRDVQGGEAPFASNRGTLTHIDCIAAPAEILPWLDLCRVLLTT